MTDQSAAAWRPGPWAAPPGTPRLRVVPDDPETATCNPPEDTPSITSEQVNPSEITDGTETATPRKGRIGLWWAASKAYWTPPAVFTDRPASLDELRAYATAAPWTHQKTGPIRALGVGYYRFVAYPRTVRLRYTEWFWQRPLRLAAYLGGIKLLSMTGPGDWVVHTV